MWYCTSCWTNSPVAGDLSRYDKMFMWYHIHGLLGMLINGQLWLVSRVASGRSFPRWFYIYVDSLIWQLASLTHSCRVMHISVRKLTSIGSDNGLAPGRCQAILWTNAWIFFIGPLGTNFSENLIEIMIFSFKKMCLKVSSAKWRPFCLGLNVLGCHSFHWVWFDLLIAAATFPSKLSRD